MILFITAVSIKIEKDDEHFAKNEASEQVSEAQNSDNGENDIKPLRSRSPSRTWASSAAKHTHTHTHISWIQNNKSNNKKDTNI